MAGHRSARTLSTVLCSQSCCYLQNVTLDQCTGHLVDLNRSFCFDRFYPLGKPYFDLRLISLKELASWVRKCIVWVKGPVDCSSNLKMNVSQSYWVCTEHYMFRDSVTYMISASLDPNKCLSQIHHFKTGQKSTGHNKRESWILSLHFLYKYFFLNS